MGRSKDQVGQLVAAHRERDSALAPLRTMLDTPGDEFAEEEPEDRGQ